MQAFKPSLSARRAWIEIAALAVSAARWRSLSARRAWIEIHTFCAKIEGGKSLSARRAWIEIFCQYIELDRDPKSLSARRAWIEIPFCTCMRLCESVALRKESVDRNQKLGKVS